MLHYNKNFLIHAFAVLGIRLIIVPKRESINWTIVLRLNVIMKSLGIKSSNMLI